MERQSSTKHHDLETRTAEIAARLRRVCADMPDADFASMVERMAHVEINYERRLMDEAILRMEGAAHWR